VFRNRHRLAYGVVVGRKTRRAEDDMPYRPIRAGFELVGRGS
jgi:hypothetical protein